MVIRREKVCLCMEAQVRLDVGCIIR